MLLYGAASRRDRVALNPPTVACRGCVEVVVMAISSLLCCQARIVSLLALATVLTGCQGLTRGGGGEPIPPGTLSVSPPSLSFGNVIVGKNSTLKGALNAAGGPVTVSSATSSSAEFAVSGISFPASLDAGQSLSYTVTFTPQASGAASATLSFTSNAAGSPSLQSVDGTGTPAPQHSVDLSWDASQSPGVVGYNVYRGDRRGGPYSRINASLEASTSYTDALVNGGATYYYVATAVDGNGLESGYSQQVKAVIPAP